MSAIGRPERDVCLREEGCGRGRGLVQEDAKWLGRGHKERWTIDAYGPRGHTLLGLTLVEVAAHELPRAAPDEVRPAHQLSYSRKG